MFRLNYRLINSVKSTLLIKLLCARHALKCFKIALFVMLSGKCKRDLHKSARNTGAACFCKQIHFLQFTDIIRQFTYPGTANNLSRLIFGNPVASARSSIYFRKPSQVRIGPGRTLNVPAILHKAGSDDIFYNFIIFFLNSSDQIIH